MHSNWCKKRLDASNCFAWLDTPTGFQVSLTQGVCEYSGDSHLTASDILLTSIQCWAQQWSSPKDPSSLSSPPQNAALPQAGYFARPPAPQWLVASLQGSLCLGLTRHLLPVLILCAWLDLCFLFSNLQLRVLSSVLNRYICLLNSEWSFRVTDSDAKSAHNSDLAGKTLLRRLTCLARLHCSHGQAFCSLRLSGCTIHWNCPASPSCVALICLSSCARFFESQSRCPANQL